MDFKVTDAMVRGARDYVPIAEKMEFVEKCATDCIKAVQVSGSRENEQYPKMFAEDTETKARYLFGGFLKLYLSADFKPVEGTDFLMSRDDYDRWMRNHPMNAMERMKSTKDTADRNKVFDLLADYKTLKKMLDTEVYSCLHIMNDHVYRMFETANSFFSQDFEKMAENIKTAQETISKGKKKSESK